MLQNTAKKDLGKRSTEMVEADGRRRLCPFIHSPHEDCYITHMNSLSVETIVKYCGGSFEECPVYRHLMEGKS